MALRKLKKIKYRVTGAFGDLGNNEIVDAYILLREQGSSALIFHPKDEHGCAFLEMGIEDKDNSEIFVRHNTENSDMFGRININKQELKALIKNLEKVLEFV